MKKAFFYENQSSLDLYHNFVEVFNLIKSSYDRIITCAKDRNSGWELINHSWKFNKGEWFVNVNRDLTLVDFLESEENDNIWIITIVYQQ